MSDESLSFDLELAADYGRTDIREPVRTVTQEAAVSALHHLGGTAFRKTPGGPRVSLEQAAEILDTISGAKIISFVAETEARLRKKGNPFGPVVKRARVNALVNFHYDPAVLKRLAREGKDESYFRRGTSWHEPVYTPDGKLTPFCRHKLTGDLYLRVVRLATVGEPEYRTAGGEPVDFAALVPYLDQRRGYENQGTDDPVVFQTFRLDGLREITVDGVVYTLGV